MEFEAQAAIALEQAATRHVAAAGWPEPLAWTLAADGQLDLLPALGILAECERADFGAAQFHSTLVAGLADWSVRAAEASGIDTIALGGGCFLNKLLSVGLRDRLSGTGLKVLDVRQLSPGDAGLAVGQAWIAQRSL
jgi:hydrogenase maturation protein HypF